MIGEADLTQANQPPGFPGGNSYGGSEGKSYPTDLTGGDRP